MRITSKHIETAAYCAALIIAAWFLSGCAVQLRTGLDYKGMVQPPSATLKNTYHRKSAFERAADMETLRRAGFTKSEPYNQ